MKKNKTLIIGISGQDGSTLAKKLLNKKITVHGVCRNLKSKNLIKLKILKKVKLFKVKNNYKILKKILLNNYKYIYFLGGQPNVNKSFDKLEEETYTSQIEPLKIILEHIRIQKNFKTKLLFSSSCEIFGYQKKIRFKETDDKKPLSPYGLSKLIGFEIVKSYREMFNLPVFSIIFFNHESNLRDGQYIFKKISNYLKTKEYTKKKLQVGNINVKRDWGWGPEYMEILIKIMHHKTIDDYILATGKSVSLKSIIKLFFLKYKLNYKKHVISKKSLFRKFDIKENYANINKLKIKMKVSPIYYYKNLIDLV